MLNYIPLHTCLNSEVHTKLNKTTHHLKFVLTTLKGTISLQEHKMLYNELEK